MKPRASARIVLPTLAVLFVVAVCPVAAQDPDARHVSVGAAAGLATPLHGDFDFTATAWQADVRFDTARYFGFGVFFEEWRHTEEDIFTDQTISGPNGPLGRAERTTVRTDHRTRALGWNLLARATASRVTVSGGGGVSYLLYSRDFTQTTSGCEPASLCRDFGQEFDNSSFAAQLQFGVDVGITRARGGDGTVSCDLPDRGPGCRSPHDRGWCPRRVLIHLTAPSASRNPLRFALSSRHDPAARFPARHQPRTAARRSH